MINILLSNIVLTMRLPERFHQKLSGVIMTTVSINAVRPLQFNYLSFELFLKKKSCQTPKKKKKKVNFGVLRTKVVWKFSVRLQKKKKKKC